MSPSHLHARQYTQPTFVELFTPKLVTVFREGYGWRDLRADAVAGLTVAVVALPLSMAIAIASGVSPERGLYTAIAGGLIISLIGGSRFPDSLPTVGVVLGALLFLHRMAESVEIAGGQSPLEEVADDSDPRPRYDAQQATNRDVMVYQISGAFFFGATARVLGVLERVGAPPRLLILDFKDVPLIDTTAARSLVTFVNKVGRLGTSVVFAAARPTVRRNLTRAGLKPPLVRYSATARDAATMEPQ